MNSILKLILGLAFVYIALLLLLVVFQRSFMYFPNKNKPSFTEYGSSANGFQIVKTITEDGLTLEAWYHPASDPEKPTFLWFHGNGGRFSDRVYWAQKYTQKGYGVLLAEYRGYGGNLGTPTELNLYKDAHSWVKLVQNDLMIPLDKLVFYGESLGTGIAVKMATEYEAYALILHTPYKSTRAIAEKLYPIFPIRYLMKDQYDSLSRINQIKVPVFMMHGTRDEVIPYAHAVDLYEAAPEPKGFYSIDGAMHSNIYNFGADSAVLNFLEALKNNALQK